LVNTSTSTPELGSESEQIHANASGKLDQEIAETHQMDVDATSGESKQSSASTTAPASTLSSECDEQLTHPMHTMYIDKLCERCEKSRETRLATIEARLFRDTERRMSVRISSMNNGNGWKGKHFRATSRHEANDAQEKSSAVGEGEEERHHPEKRHSSRASIGGRSVHEAMGRFMGNFKSVRWTEPVDPDDSSENLALQVQRVSMSSSPFSSEGGVGGMGVGEGGKKINGKEQSKETRLSFAALDA
jgi:hypothetical protein